MFYVIRKERYWFSFRPQFNDLRGIFRHISHTFKVTTDTFICGLILFKHGIANASKVCDTYASASLMNTKFKFVLQCGQSLIKIAFYKIELRD